MKGKCKIIVPNGKRNNIVGLCVIILSHFSVIVKQIRLYIKDPHRYIKRGELPMEALLATINNAIEEAKEMHLTINTDIISVIIHTIPDAVDVGNNQIIVYYGEEMADISMDRITYDPEFEEYYCNGTGCSFIISFD